MRSFLVAPSRARTRVVVGALIAGILVIETVTTSVVPLVLWGALMVGTVLLMLEDSTGGVTNDASILTGRRIALAARGRGKVSLDHVSSEKRRERWLAFLTALAIVVAAIAVAVVNG